MKRVLPGQREKQGTTAHTSSFFQGMMSLERRRRQAAAAPVTQSNGSRFNLRGFSQIFLPKSSFTLGRFSIELQTRELSLLIEAFYSFFNRFELGFSRTW